MAKTLDPMERSQKLIMWVDVNVFRGDKHNKHTHSRISKYAAKDLGLDVDEESIAQAIAIIGREKNFNLEKYSFD